MAEVQATFKMIPYFPQDNYHWLLCENCKAAGRSPMAKHAHIPDPCDFVYEPLVTGGALRRPHLSNEAFLSLGVPVSWIDGCLEAKAITDELIRP
jgi:hypothetical protein